MIGFIDDIDRSASRALVVLSIVVTPTAYCEPLSRDFDSIDEIWWKRSRLICGACPPLLFAFINEYTFLFFPRFSSSSFIMVL